MAAQLSHVTPDVLRWAIDEDGRSVPELAEALNVDVDTIDGWTRGDATPTRGQVSRLATVLHRPRALFFLPRPPTSATLPANFRHPPGDDQPVSVSARRQVRRARRVQHAVSWARRDDPPVSMPSGSLNQNPEFAAREVCRWLGISDADRESWQDDRAALRSWRQAMEDSGVLVFILQIGSDDVRGFSAWDDRAPLVVANSSRVSPAARSFTLVHELAHLYLRQDAACIERDAINGPSNQIERWCEQFGASLLMPQDSFTEFMATRGNPPFGLEDVREVAKRFRVSHRAAALRMIDLHYASPALYGQVTQVFEPRVTESVSSTESGEFYSPPRYVQRPREYGIGTIRTVLDALPTRDALDILRLTVEDVRHIAQEVPDVRVP
jgi:Zn-dependent peptidase ImmA (M78 family)/transcriptional regulator with XRE-family HTH domain